MKVRQVREGSWDTNKQRFGLLWMDLLRVGSSSNFQFQKCLKMTAAPSARGPLIYKIQESGDGRVRELLLRGRWRGLGGGDGGADSSGVGAVDGDSVNAFLAAALTRVMRAAVPIPVLASTSVLQSAVVGGSVVGVVGPL